MDYLDPDDNKIERPAFLAGIPEANEPAVETETANETPKAEAEQQTAASSDPNKTAPVKKSVKKVKKKKIWWKNVLALLWIFLVRKIPIVNFLVAMLVVYSLACLINPDGTNGVTCNTYTWVYEDLGLRLDPVDLKSYVSKDPVVVGEEADYTIMVYMLGSNLESQGGAGTSDIEEMLLSKREPGVRIVLYTGGSYIWKNNLISAKKNQIYLIDDKGIRFLKEEDKRNMADPKVLSDFIQYSMKNFPAKNTGLILWDHGDGPIWGFGAVENTSDIDTMMEVPEIEQALRDGLQGEKLGFLAFDACLMGSIEILESMSAYTDWMVASPETTSAIGFQYTYFLNELYLNHNMEPKTLCTKICDAYARGCTEDYESYSDYEKYLYNKEIVICTYDLTRASDTVAGLNQLSARVKDRYTPEYLTTLASQMKGYGMGSFDQVDLGMWASCFLDDYPTESMNLVSLLDNMVYYRIKSDDIGFSSGVAAFYPFDSNGTSFLTDETYQTGYCEINWSGEQYAQLVDDAMNYTNSADDYTEEELFMMMIDWLFGDVQNDDNNIIEDVQDLNPIEK